MIMRNNVLIGSVLHPESAGDCPQSHKPELFIQPEGICIAFHHCVKLQNTESQFFSLLHAVPYKLFPDMLSPHIPAYCVTCIADVPAPPYVVGMQDIKPDDFSRRDIAGKSRK